MDFNYGIPGGGSIGNMFSSFMNPQQGYQDAANQMQQYYGQAQGYLQPYAQNGQTAGGNLFGQQAALGDPAALENQWASGYSESPYAQQMTNKATQAGMNAASSMGLMGSSPAINNVQQSAGDIMQSDRQSYMNDLMQKYMGSVGINQGMYNTGAGAAGEMGQNAMNQGKNMAGAAYGAANAPGQMFGNLLGMGVNAGVNYATGGMGGRGMGGGMGGGGY